MEKSNAKILRKLQCINENELTKTILIPLFEKLGYIKVEFFGGTNEEGKDILCWDIDKLGSVKLYVAQVKHFKFSNKSSGSNSFQTIVNQLATCLSKPMKYTDHNSYIPNEVWLISTYKIDTKTLQTRFSEQPTLIDRKIKIIDGVDLTSLIMKHSPELVPLILGEDIPLNEYIDENMSNELLLKALAYNEKKSLKKIFTDIDFSLGRNSTRLFFHCQYKSINRKFELDSEEWEDLKNTLLQSSPIYNLNYIDNTLEQIEDNYKQDTLLLNSWHDDEKEIRRAISKLEKKIKKYQRSLISSNDEISSNKGPKTTDQKQNDKEHVKHSLKVAKIELAATKIKLKNHLKDEPSLLYKFELNASALEEQIIKYRTEIESVVSSYNVQQPNYEDLKTFISKCDRILKASSIILNNNLIKSSLGVDDSFVLRDDLSPTRLKISISKIFETHINLTVLGEAGAGKTTNLQMYAINNLQNDDKTVLWIPLPTLVKEWSLNTKEIDSTSKIANFEEALCEFINNKGIAISMVNLKKILKSKKTTILFDSLDESISNNHWLTDAINKFATKYHDNCQVIVTSRVSEKHVDRLNFFTVTLLPFTDIQRNDFINKWFDEKDKYIAEQVKRHIKENEAINELSKTPLIVTILCTLASHKLPLPETEIKLYNDRLNLLTGYYDNVKNISTRISTSPRILEVLAKKIALELHKKGIRQAPINVLQEIAINKTSHLMNPEQAVQALTDLINPCNILVPMNEQGMFGFGHLRFQEHLAASEILSNRSMDIARIMNSGWWHETLILFARMNDDLSWLIKQLGHGAIHSKYNRTLTKMIEVLPHWEKKSCFELLKQIKFEMKGTSLLLLDKNNDDFDDDLYDEFEIDWDVK